MIIAIDMEAVVRRDEFLHIDTLRELLRGGSLPGDVANAYRSASGNAKGEGDEKTA